MQCKPPVTRWCNNPSLAGKRPVWIKSQIQYLRNVPAFRSAGHNCQYAFTNFDNTKHENTTAIVENLAEKVNEYPLNQGC